MKPSIHLPLSAAVFAILILMGFPHAEGASTAPRETPTFELAALRLGDMELPELYYAEVTKGADGKAVTTYKPLEIGSGARTVSNTIPLTSPLRIFSGDPSVKDGLGMKIWADVPAGSAGEKVLLLFFFDPNGQMAHRFLEESAKAHPASTVKALNLTAESMNFATGSQQTTVPAGQSAMITPALDVEGRFYLTVLTSPSIPPTPKRIYFPGKEGRLLLVYSLSPAEEPTGRTLPDGNEEMKRVLKPFAHRIFDQTPEK